VTLQIGDLTVNRLGFGAMRVCGTNVWGPPRNRENSIQVLRRAIDLGVNFFDTADSYGPNVDEELIAEALYPYPRDLVIATKGGLLRPRPSGWIPDGRPEHLKRALDGSLTRLKLDCIDLYQLHAPDSNVPFAESVGALADGQKAGKIRHVGISNVTVSLLEEARRICPIVSVQNAYNLADRSSEDVLKACERLGIAFLPWYPLGAGDVLKTKKVKDIARKLKATPAQIALAWLLAKSPVMLPIPGTASLVHLEANVKAALVALPADDIRALSRT
jgi:pyridoxine 4-dehydrogenase